MDRFELTVQRRVNGAWPVVAVGQPGDGSPPVRTEGRMRLDPAGLTSVDARAYGAALGRALFADDVALAFARAQAAAAERLHVLLSVEDGEIKSYRWERLCAPLDGGWRPLVLDQRTPFALAVASPIDRRFPPFRSEALRALVLAASPAGLADYGMEPFDVAATVEQVRVALGDVPSEVLADVPGAAGPPTLDALCTRITAGRVPLLHLVCHGAVVESVEAGTPVRRTLLYLAKADGSVDPVEAGRLIDRLANLQSAYGLPHVAFLAACESAGPTAEAAYGGLAERLVGNLGMPAVLAMTERVSVETATALAASFYARLREHGEVDRALNEAGAGLAERPDIAVPALYSRLGGRSLFGGADRAPTDEEFLVGLTRLEEVVARDAPVLAPSLAAQATALRRTLGGATETAKQEQRRARDEVNAIALEVTDRDLDAIALGKPLPLLAQTCPFPGLNPFEATDRAFFFGRDALVDTLVRKLTEHPFLAVLGPSGSGKSSLVRAGLLPRLETTEGDTGQLTIFKPGADPPAHLASALATPVSGPDMVVVDQFEEVFTLCQDDALRRAFFGRLLALSQERRVVITMRADFWGECAPYPELKAEVQAHQELVAPMTPAELRSAMDQQANTTGLRFEAGLADTIFDDVAGEPGAMPLLQHALRELWQRRHGRWLRIEEYREIGGVRGAIAHTADEIYDGFAEADRRRVRSIFVRLTRLDEESTGTEDRRDTRRRVALADLIPAGSDQAATKALIGRLADARLVVTTVDAVSGKEDVEVTHEALIRNWPLLQRWLDEDRAALHILADLGDAAREWEANGCRRGYLTHQTDRLLQAESLSQYSAIGLNDLETAYLDACRAKRSADTRRRTMVLVGSCVLTAVALTAAVVAYLQYRNAKQETAVGSARSLAGAAARELALGHDEQAALMAREAYLADEASGRHASAQVDAALRSTIESPFFSHRLSGPTSWIAALAFRPGSTELAAGGEDHKIWILDAPGSPATPTPFPELKGRVTSVAYNADGSRLASGSHGDSLGTVLLRDTDGTVLRRRLKAPVESVAFHPTAGWLASGDDDGRVLRWEIDPWRVDPDNYKPEQFAVVTSSKVFALAFSDDGTILAIGGCTWQTAESQAANESETRCPTGFVQIWDVAGQRLITSFAAAQPGGVWTLSFVPQTHRLAVGGCSARIAHADHQPCIAGDVLLWDVDHPGNGADRLSGFGADVRSVAISPDATLLAAGSDDETLRIWDLHQPWRPLAVLGGSEDRVRAVAFSSDGALLASASANGTVRLWELDVAGEPRSILRGHADWVGGLSFSQDGHWLASAGADGTVRLWDLTESRDDHELVVPEQDANRAFNTVSVRPDGAEVAAGNAKGVVLVWKMSEPEQSPLRLDAQIPGAVWSVTYSRDGRYLAAGGCGPTRSKGSCESGAVCIWDTGDWTAPACARVQELEKDEVWSVAFRPDGLVLATVGETGHVKFWQRKSGVLILIDERDAPADAPGRLRSVAFSPDGRFLAAGGEAKVLLLWDLSRRNSTPGKLGSHDGVIRSVVFSPDGRLLATGSEDQTVRLWRLDGGQPASLTIATDEHWVRAVSFSPDGRLLATTSLDGPILLRVIDRADLAERVCRRVWAELSTKEWSDAGGSGQPHPCEDGASGHGQ